MSSTLTTMVPILDGSNYLVWNQQMVSYLKAQGLFRTLAKSPPVQGKGKDEPDVSDAIEKWEDANSKALGSMMLRLHFSIAYKHRGTTVAATLMDNLQKEYGKPGVSGTFIEFKKLMDLRIPDNQDPSIALDQFIGHVSCLTEQKVALADDLQSLILLAKIPSSMGHLAQQYSQVDELSKLINVEKMRRGMLIAWEQRGLKGKQPQNQQQAQKISAVQQGPHEPGFQQQQQQGSGGRGKRRRGARGGRGGKQAQQADVEVQEQQPQQQTVAGPSYQPQANSAPAPPLPYSPFDFGHIANSVALPTPHSVYPSFQNTMNLVDRLSVRPTLEQRKILEAADPSFEVANPLIHTPTRDPRSRPRKRQRQAQEEDEVVSLGWSEDDVMAEATTFGEEDPQTIDEAGLFGRYAQFETPEHKADKTPTATNVVEYIVAPSNQICCCSSCEKTKNKTMWMLDSGASLHFTNDLDDFIEYEAIAPVLIRTATTVTHVVGRGTVILTVDGVAIRISPVYYIPDLTTRLLSLGQFMRSGLSSRGSARSITVYDKEGKDLLTFHPRHENDSIYVIWSLVGRQNCAEVSTIYAVDFEVMHRRLAHPSNDVMRRAGRHIKDFPDVQVPKEHLCPGCAQGKMTNKSFPPSEVRASVPFELIHSDLKSFPIESYHKFKYAIVFYDDFTSHAWTVNLRTKDAALYATRHFLATVEVKYQTKVRGWMTDGGGEYTSKAYTNMLKERGIQILQSVPHAHQQNGRAERIIRTLMEKAETMRLQACLPQSWWEFALDHATHVYNRTPIRRLAWQTPYQMANGDKPNISHLRVLGCLAYVFIPEEVRLNKMAPKSEMMTYLGTHPGGKGWIFMRGPNNVVFSAAQAIFDESAFPKCPKQGTTQNTRLRVQAPTPSPHHNDGNHSPPSGEELAGDEDEIPTPNPPTSKGKERAQDPLAVEQPPAAPSVPTPAPVQRRAKKPLPPPREKSTRVPKPLTKPDNIYGDKTPLEIEKGIRKMKDWRKVVEEAPVPGPSKPTPPESSPPAESEDEESSDSEEKVRESLEPSEEEDAHLVGLCRDGGVQLQKFLLSKAVSLPAKEKSPKEMQFRDILQNPEADLWKQACAEEMEALKRRKVWEMVERPRGRKVIKNRWVFDVKTDGRKKARLVAKGFSQVEGLDYDQVFSPVVRFETVRLLLAMAALENWHMTGVDVRNAYLYGELDEEIYMEQPEGFKVPGKEDQVLRLLRALYGLKQAGLAWWRALKLSMEKLGFVSLSSDAGIFLFRGKGSFVIAIVYVDDAIFMGPVRALAYEMKRRFMERWETRDLGEVTEFLRMRITRSGSKIHLDQTAYLETVLQRCGMSEAKPTTTPLPAGYVPEVNSTVASPELRSRYQTVIGSLLYLMLGTRPDISFAVTKLAQHAANPSDDHLSKALYICRYLVGTSKYRLTYDGESGQGISACTDSDWASDDTSRRSQTGYFIKLAKGLISWTSRAQKTIALSSTEAEYMALSDCSRQVVWMHTLLGELGYNMGPIPICGDNQGSIFIASNPVTEKRSKHIDIRYHYIREVIDRGLAEVYFISGEDNPADLLTKNLGRVKFQKFRAVLGLEFFN